MAFWQKCVNVQFHFAPNAHFVSCVMVWASYVEVAGSSPACGILAQMCECVISSIYKCVIASMVRLWGWQPMGPKMAHFPQLIAAKDWGEIEGLWRRDGGDAQNGAYSAAIRV